MPSFSSTQQIFIGYLLWGRVLGCAAGMLDELTTSSSVSVEFTIYWKKGHECISTRITIISHSDQVYKGKE